MLTPIPRTFLDGRDRYVAGEVRDLSPEDVQRFRTMGWLDAAAASAPVSLDIQDGRIGHTNEVNHG